MAKKTTPLNVEQREIMSFLMGIPRLNVPLIVKIVNQYPSWEAFNDATTNVLRQLKGVGPQTVKAIDNARITRNKQLKSRAAANRLRDDQAALEEAAEDTGRGRGDQSRRPESVWLCCKKVGKQIEVEPKKLHALITDETIPVSRLFDAAAGVPEAIDQLVEDVETSKEAKDDRPDRLGMALWLIRKCGSSQAALDAVVGAARGLGEKVTIEP